MIIVTALRTHAAATKTEELVAGRVGMEAAFHFSPEWDGLGKTAVFEAGGVAKDVIIGDDPCIVPHECMIEGAELRVGIYGMSTDGTIVIPTVYALVGTVKKGADPSGDESYPPTPDVGEQAIAAASAAMQAAAAAQEVAAEIQRRADNGEFDGAPGKDGNDYVLTEADKVEIAEIAADLVDVPEGGGSADLTGYATEEWVEKGYQPKGNYLTEVPAGYAKTEDIPTKPSDIGAQPAGNYMTEVPAGYATEEYVRNKIAEAELGGEEVDLSGYAQKSELPTKVSQLENDKGYLTEHQDISGKLDASALPTAINTALAQAKASGEFDGEDGQDGINGKDGVSATHSWSGTTLTVTSASGTSSANLKGDKGDKGDTGGTGAAGTSVTVKSVSESTADGGSNVVTFSDGKTLTVKNGSKGSKGDKGDTGATGATGAAGKDGADGLPGDPGADGVDGITPVRGVDYWNPDDIAEIEAHIATELAKRGQLKPEYAESVEWLSENGDQTKLYVLPDGMIYAWMLTEKEVAGGGYTNLLPSATDTDRKTIYGGDYNGDGVNDGYQTPLRLSGSSGNTSSASAPMCASGFIPAKNGDVIRIKGARGVTGVVSYVISYNSSNARIANKEISQASDLFWSDKNTWCTVDTADDNLLTFTLSSDNFGTGIDAIRFSGNMTSGNVIVTVNEEIKEGSTTIVKEEAWASTGHAFVPADYEPRIIDLEEQVAENTADIRALKKGSVDTGGVDALTWIRNWDSPIYDRVPVFQLSAENPAVTSAEQTVDAVYAKYDALMAANSRYITKTNMGMCSDGVTPVYRYDFREPEPHHQSGMQWSETKPTIIIVSGIHIEWGGIYSLYYAMKEIASNPELDNLRRNVHFVVVPVMNPYCIVGAYSQTYGVQNANGVEIHRNFEVGFKYPGESGYIEPGNRSHGGTAPLSEVESQYIDNLFKQYPDAALFMTCHSAQRDTRWGTGFIWASTATEYTCNLGYRLVDKMSKAWHKKYGTTWEEGCVRENNFVLANPTTYPNGVQLEEGDYRAGHAHVSSTNGTETRQATKYGIQGANVEVLDTFWVLSSTGLDSKLTTHGAEVYINYLLSYMGCYDHKDKKQYYIQ